MFAATRVMAAGKAGLESLPYFVDEMLAQGITQLAPWAADHSQEQIDTLNKIIQERRNGEWEKVFQIGSPDTRIGVQLRPDTVQTSRLLGRINPRAWGASQLADHPALLAAWCRINLWQYCRDTYAIWESFKYEHGISNDQQLSVVIPYCPEGPTSGTLGMYLGAALRKYFADRRKPNEPNQLVVWGIELCPPINEEADGTLDALAVRNIFRGFVAREELTRKEGLPLSEDPDDTGSTKPFDINIAFDGGTTKAPYDDIEDIHHAMDRAAAQTTACLLNGANAGDVPEGTNSLLEGGRWNTYLVHVVSQRSYEPGCRYLNYHVRLPWVRDPHSWENSGTSNQKEKFRACIGQEILPLLESEKDLSVRETIETLVSLSNQAQAIKRDGPIFNIFTGNHKRVKGLLEQAEQLSKDYANQLNQPSPSIPSVVVVRRDPFCVNITLPNELRWRAAEQMRNPGDTAPPIANLLGNSQSVVREHIQEFCSKVLQRSDCLGPESNSQARFSELFAIKIGAESGRGNRIFEPAQEILGDFISADRRGRDGAFNSLTYSLPNPVRPTEPRSSDPTENFQTLRWKLKRVNFDIPVEYSFLTLARCRPEDGFKDISTYDRLLESYRDRIGDLSTWRDYARYYGVVPPKELVDGAPTYDTNPSDVDQSSPVSTDGNGYQSEDYVPELDKLESEADANTP